VGRAGRGWVAQGNVAEVPMLAEVPVLTGGAATDHQQRFWAARGHRRRPTLLMTGGGGAQPWGRPPQRATRDGDVWVRSPLGKSRGAARGRTRGNPRQRGCPMNRSEDG
jgi:hypothetical protein